jgi:hypothetical protein
MVRFLLLSILIVFATASCAGPDKVGWTKPDFRQDQFNKDQDECIHQIFGNGLGSHSFGKALDECLMNKGYKYNKCEVSTKTSLLTFLGIIGNGLVEAGLASLNGLSAFRFK